ncbi:MAG: hormogonium polysaccharide biosynthesis glycosyltransferase HpsE [Spirulina sp.]
MIDLTVAICTYNGAKRLPKVLENLKNQILTESLNWEIVIIDNNSNDNTAQTIQDYQTNWTRICSLKYAFEPKQGVAFARRRAIQMARGFLVAFLDDDNLPTPNWVASVYHFGRQHPRAGAYGSHIQAEYEIEPPKNFNQIACCLAVIDRGSIPFRYDLMKSWLFPAGAGLAIRKQAWLECVPNTPILKGVVGKSLESKGEEIEALSYLRKREWEIWHNPDMKIYHVIPKSRLQKDYLVELLRGIGLSRYSTRMLKYAMWQKPLAIPAHFLNDCRKLLVHYLQYRSVLKTDIVAACQLSLLWYSTISPFYDWYERIKN